MSAPLRTLVFVVVVAGAAVAAAGGARAEEATAPAQGGAPVIDDLAPVDLAPATTLVPAYDRRPWLLVLPALCLLIVMWNVDWREGRVTGEIARARAARAPKGKTTP